jgi:3-hydroxymyristoyl/3-hydroxydecanoyl-(acyl carrier protein) dehydratase
MNQLLLKIFTLVLFSVCTTTTWSQVIASCNNPEGYAYYHHSGGVSKKSSGFDKDKITGGMTTIQKMPDGSYDILIVDTRKKIMSMTQDGGKVLMLRKGAKDATFLLYFPGNAIELYTLWIDAEGQAKYDYIASKGGDITPVHKSAVMVGRCDEINFNLITN